MGLFDFIGDLVGASASMKAADKANSTAMAINSQNIALQNQTNAQQMMMFQESRADIDRYNELSRADTRYYHESNLAAQQEAAKNAIQWRMADAVKAGVHPLYALGNPGISVGPSGAFTSAPAAATSPQLTAPRADMYSGASGDPSYLANMGQGVGRALASMMGKKERIQAQKIAQEEAQYQRAVRGQQLERGYLENDVLRSEIARNLKPEYAGPGAPPIGRTSEYGSAARDNVRVVPVENDSPASAMPGRESGSISEVGYSRRPDGSIGIVRSRQMAERLEDDFFGGAAWNINNSILPFLRGLRPPSPREFPLPRGASRWQWDYRSQSFRPYYDKRRKGDRYRSQR